MAHGLVLQLEEMLQRNLVCRKDTYEIVCDEDKIIKSWFIAISQAKFYKLDFYRLLRKTLLFVLCPSSLREPKKKELIKGVIMYFNTYCNSSHYVDLRKPVLDVIREPWNNRFFTWEELFQKKITVKDKKVQEYFAVEPEEIVLARIHAFVIQGKEDVAMILAKSSFLYHSRVAKNFSNRDSHTYKQDSQPVSIGSKYRKGNSSMDWYLFFLQKKYLPAIVCEMNQLTCHEGVLLIYRLRRSKKNQNFIFSILQILLMKELVQPSKYCCTKKIFSLWCIMHKEKRSSPLEINQGIRKMLASHAPSSAHFYLFADALWEQFGSSLITLYVELYVRGLTVDMNHYEVAKFSEGQDDITYLESHIASVFAKLSTLFSDFHEGAARECMFSAFSLKPTKERLYILQSLTHSILSSENEIKLNCSFGINSALQECKCDVRCDGSCKGSKEYYLEHPLLKKGISNVPYILVKDLVSVLEGVRCFRFQYNCFDWRNNATDLGDYLKDFTLSRSWECDTEYASEGSNKSDMEDDSPVYESVVNDAMMNESPYALTRMEDRSLNLTVKRKSESDDTRELFSLDIGANIEVGNDNLSKRIKIDEQKANGEIGHIFSNSIKPVTSFSASIGMEDAIENVIRMTLDKNKPDSDLLKNSNFMNTSLNHANDGLEHLNLSGNKHMPGNHVYPYSLTTLGKRKNLNQDFKGSECSSVANSSLENANKYTSNFATKPSSICQMLTDSSVNRESVISPSIKSRKKILAMQEQALKQLGQNKLISIKTLQVPGYGYTKDSFSSNSANKKAPVCQQRNLQNLNMDCNNTYEQARNVHNIATQNSQFVSNKTMQVLQKPGISASSDFSKTKFLSNTSVKTPRSMTSPVNVIQTKETLAMQHSSFPPTSHSASRSDSRFHFVNHNTVDNTVVRRVDQSISCYQDNQLVHCDRSSVIQRTMQHVRDNPPLCETTDVDMPNQLVVSVNSNAAEQIRCAPKEDITNLPPFTVNVPDRAIPNSSLAVSASLVITRKPQMETEMTSPQSVSYNVTTVGNSDTITIPGILSSPSVIVTPWEAQHKSHGELLYKKNAHAVNATSIHKRIYKNRPPYTKQILLKSEPKPVGQTISADKNTNSQVLKAAASASHISSTFVALPSVNQNHPHSSQVWSVVNKSSTQGVSQSASSQPWYSEPYPKPYNSANKTPSNSSGNLAMSLEQNVSSLIKTFQPVKQTSNVKSYSVFTKQMHQSKNSLQDVSSAAATVSHSLNNPAPSSTKSSVLNNISTSSPNVTAHSILQNPTLHKDFITTSLSSSQSSSMTNVKTSTQCNLITNSSKSSSHQYVNKPQYGSGLVQESSPVVFTAPNVVDAKLSYCQSSSKNFSNSCCSPSEINPCQNCSLSPVGINLVEISSPKGRNLVQNSNQRHADRNPEEASASNKKMIASDSDAETAIQKLQIAQKRLQSELNDLRVENSALKEEGLRSRMAYDTRSRGTSARPVETELSQLPAKQQIMFSNTFAALAVIIFLCGLYIGKFVL